MKVMSYNMRHGRGEDDLLSLARIARNIEQSGALIIGLQEVDRYFGERSDFQDQAKVLATTLQMDYAYGANLVYPPLIEQGEKRAYGNAILTKYPIIASRNIPLCSAGDEPRGLLQVTLDINGSHLNVYTTHLAENKAIRMRQTEKLVEHLKTDPGPKIVLGDFNAEPLSEELTLVKSQTDLVDVFAAVKERFTYSASKPVMCIDYILISTDLSSRQSEVIDVNGSDHLPLVTSVRS